MWNLSFYVLTIKHIRTAWNFPKFGVSQIIQLRVFMYNLIKCVNMLLQLQHCCTLYCAVSYCVPKFFYIIHKTSPGLSKLLALLFEYL